MTETKRPTYFGVVREELPADDDAAPVKVMIPLSPAEPFLFLRRKPSRLWEEAIDAQEQLDARASGTSDHRIRAVPARGHSDGGGRSIVRGVGRSGGIAGHAAAGKGDRDLHPFGPDPKLGLSDGGRRLDLPGRKHGDHLPRFPA